MTDPSIPLNSQETEWFNVAWQRVQPCATHIGDQLVALWPPVRHEKDGKDGLACYIPADMTNVIADLMTATIAEVLQAWLDAGSEREVTEEELGDAIRDHVHGWGSRS